MKDIKNSDKCFKIIDWIVKGLIIVHIAIILIGIFCSIQKDIIKESLLVRYYNVAFTPEEREAKLKSLSKWLDLEISFYDKILLNNKSVRMQTRLSFIALLAILLIPLLRKKKVKRIKQLGIVIIAYILFLSFYFFDIHTVDLDFRQTNIKRSYIITTRELLNISLNDTFKFDIRLSRPKEIADILKKCDKQFKYCDKKLVGCCKEKCPKLRKLCNSIHPDFSQISFYIIPITVVLGIYLFIPKINKENPYKSVTQK